MIRTTLIIGRAAIWAFLIAVSVPFFWQLTTNGTTLVVTGESMRPTYELGDVVFLNRVTDPPHDFWKTGDIVAVAFIASEPEDNRYIHRVERILDDGRAVLKGDGNPEEDVSPVDLDQVVGTPALVLHAPYADAYVYSQTWWGRIVIFGSGILALIGLEALANRMAKKQSTKHATVTKPDDTTRAEPAMAETTPAENA